MEWDIFDGASTENVFSKCGNLSWVTLHRRGVSSRVYTILPILAGCRKVVCCFVGITIMYVCGFSTQVVDEFVIVTPIY